MGNSPGPRRDHTASAHAMDAVAVAVVLTIALGSSVVRWFTTLNHDAAYFLAQAKMLSQGRNLYDDLIDKDTPVNTLIAQVSIALSSMTGLPPDRMHLAVLSAILCVSVAVGCLLVRRFAGPNSLGFLAFAVASSLAVFVIPADDFGQRDHLFAAVVCPYVIAVAMHWRGFPRRPGEVALVSALASVGFFIKPHFVAFAMAIWIAELAVARGNLRRVSTETWLTVVGTVGSYGAFLILEPGYLASVVPSQAATYLEYRRDFVTALWGYRTRLALVALSLALSSLLVWDDGRRHLRMLVLRLGWPLFLVGVIVVGIQGFGFRYHVLPLFMWGLLLYTTIGAQVVASMVGAGAHPPAWVRVMAVTSLACALVPSLQLLASAVKRQYAVTTRSPRSATADHPFVRILNLNGPGHYAYIFCTSVFPGGLAFAYADTRWSGHTIALSALPLIHDHRTAPARYPRVDPARLARIEANERHLIARDFVERPADLVLFDVGPTKRWFKTPGFDYLTFLSEDEAFRELWTRYRYSEVGDVQDFDGRPFRVFVRSGSSIDRSELGRLVTRGALPAGVSAPARPAG